MHHSKISVNLSTTSPITIWSRRLLARSVACGGFFTQFGVATRAEGYPERADRDKGGSRAWSRRMRKKYKNSCSRGWPVEMHSWPAASVSERTRERERKREKEKQKARGREGEREREPRRSISIATCRDSRRDDRTKNRSDRGVSCKRSDCKHTTCLHRRREQLRYPGRRDAHPHSHGRRLIASKSCHFRRIVFLSFAHERSNNDVVEMSSESCASPRRQRSAISTLVKSDLDPVESSKIREYRRGVPVRNANLPRIEATRLLTYRIATPSRQYFSAISGRSIANWDSRGFDARVSCKRYETPSTREDRVSRRGRTLPASDGGIVVVVALSKSSTTITRRSVEANHQFSVEITKTPPARKIRRRSPL